MKWRTAIESISYPFQISLDTKMLLLGSCFAENMGDKFGYHKFLATINPTGISYNPISLAENVKRAVSQNYVSESELEQNGEKYVHFDFHGHLGHFNSAVCQEHINTKIKQLNQSILESDIIFISLGSAIVFEHIEKQKIVSNCHKFPQDLFTKIQLTNVEITDSLDTMIASMFQINTNVKIIMTVSPVRHTRHGLIENNRSKANLIAAVHELVDKNDKVFYFPSYEIVMDDLRDYRFFKRDLVHPSEEAVDYIWHYLMSQFMTDQTQQELKSIKSLADTYHHIPMSTSPEKKNKFLSNLKDKIKAHQYNERFTKEIADIDNRIKKMTVV